jgi:hypothetical protein
MFWGDTVLDVSQLTHQETSVPEVQYPTFECDPSPILSPFAAIASMYATSGVSEAASQTTWTHTTSAQDLIPEDLHEIFACFIQDRDSELKNSSNQISAPIETWDVGSLDGDHWMSKQAMEEIVGAYDLEREHGHHAFNVQGLNNMNLYQYSDMYSSPQS